MIFFSDVNLKHRDVSFLFRHFVSRFQNLMRASCRHSVAAPIWDFILNRGRLFGVGKNGCLRFFRPEGEGKKRKRERGKRHFWAPWPCPCRQIPEHIFRKRLLMVTKIERELDCIFFFIVFFWEQWIRNKGILFCTVEDAIYSLPFWYNRESHCVYISRHSKSPDYLFLSLSINEPGCPFIRWRNDGK